MVQEVQSSLVQKGAVGHFLYFPWGRQRLFFLGFLHVSLLQWGCWENLPESQAGRGWISSCVPLRSTPRVQHYLQPSPSGLGRISLGSSLPPELAFRPSPPHLPIGVKPHSHYILVTEPCCFPSGIAPEMPCLDCELTLWISTPPWGCWFFP